MIIKTKLAASKTSLCNYNCNFQNNSNHSSVRKNALRFGLSLSVMSSLFALPAMAQTKQANADLRLDEIVVTATKREKNLQEVPLSVTAFNALKLESLNVEGLTELSNHVPNLYLPASTEAGQSYLTIRGISAGVTNHTGRSVGVYIDGVYVNADTALNTPLFGIESVEVLKGPQGTLFGRDTIAGAVNITTSAPSADEVKGWAEYEIGNYGRRQASFQLDAPLIKDVLAFRVNARKLDTDGYIENSFNGNFFGAQDQFGLSGQLYYTPNDQFEAKLVYRYRNVDDRPNTEGESITGMGSDQTPYTLNLDTDEIQRQTQHAGSLNMRYELGNGHSLHSVTGLSDVDDFYSQDGDRLPQAITIAQFDSRYKEFSQEFRIESPSDQKMTYLLGLYYLDASSQYSPTFPLMNTAFLEVLEQDVFNVPAGPRPADRLDGQFVEENIQSVAVFAHGEYAINDRLDLFAGLRYTDEKKTLDYSIFGESFERFYELYYAQIPTGINTSELEANPLSWTVGARYAVSDDINTYASISRGYRSGSVKDDFITQSEIDAGEGFFTEPEFVTNYEAGIKAQFLDGRVRTNLSAFYMDYTDIQVAISDPRFPFFRLLANAASAHITGFEAEFEAQVTQSLRASAAIGHVKTRYDEFMPSAGQDLSGTGFGSSPDWTINAALDYIRAVNDQWDFVAHVDHTDQSVPDDFAPQSHPLAFVGDYGVTNASIGARTKTWEASLWVKNLFDVQDPAVNFVWGRGLGSRIENETVSYEPPRMYGATFAYRFGG